MDLVLTLGQNVLFLATTKIPGQVEASKPYVEPTLVTMAHVDELLAAGWVADGDAEAFREACRNGIAHDPFAGIGD